ncbi:hypothetical protein PCK2_000805, partial [Pneumocystis canis]
LVDDSILPVLGPLPPNSPGQEKSDDDAFDPDMEDKNEDEEEEEEEDDDIRHKRRRRETKVKSYEPPKVMRFDTGDIKRKRGRPPKVDTPDEARMKVVLRVIRKEKDERGRTLFTWFEKFPDDKLNHTHKIKQSITLDDIRQKLKRREYKTLKFFLDDLDLLYNNVKLISPPGSHMHRDSDYLQQVTHEVASIEASKRDIDFSVYEKDPTSSIGTLIKVNRTPLPKIEVRGEILEIGDWVHLINHNDENKPIIAQIFNLWENLEGEKWIINFTLHVTPSNFEDIQLENINVSENDLEKPNIEKTNENFSGDIDKNIKNIDIKNETQKINETNNDLSIENGDKTVENIKNVKKNNDFSDEVAALFSRDEQGRVLWFPVPPIDVVSPTLETFVQGRSLAYLANIDIMMEKYNEELKEEKKQKSNTLKTSNNSMFSEFLITALNTMTQNIKSSIS